MSGCKKALPEHIRGCQGNLSPLKHQCTISMIASINSFRKNMLVFYDFSFTNWNYHPWDVWRQEFIAQRVCNSVWFPLLLSQQYEVGNQQWIYLAVRWICLQEGCPNSVGALEYWTGLDWTGLDYTCTRVYLPTYLEHTAQIMVSNLGWPDVLLRSQFVVSLKSSKCLVPILWWQLLVHWYSHCSNETKWAH